MNQKPKEQTSPKADDSKSTAEKLVLSQSEHAALTPKEKEAFRTKGGTVSNQD